MLTVEAQGASVRGCADDGPPIPRAGLDASTLWNVTDWISQVEAAELLGVTSTSVYRMVSRGDLHPRPRHGMRPSLDRTEVLALAQHRAEQAANKRKRADLRAAREAERRRMAGPPDTEHEWLTVREAAALLGVSQGGCKRRA